MALPRVVVTLDTSEVRRRDATFPSVELKHAYVRAVEEAGGLPILAAPSRNPKVLEGWIEQMDALVISGGAFDLDPALYGKDPAGAPVDPPKPLRTEFELALLKAALARDKPVLGVCGGMQLLNVALGGTLLLDIATDRPDALEHQQATSPATPAHEVALVPGTRLSALLGGLAVRVNSTHHQAVDRVGPELVVAAKSADGIIEAIEHREKPGVFGVQWHPELLADTVSLAIYRAVVSLGAPR